MCGTGNAVSWETGFESPSLRFSNITIRHHAIFPAAVGVLAKVLAVRCRIPSWGGARLLPSRFSRCLRLSGSFALPFSTECSQWFPGERDEVERIRCRENLRRRFSATSICCCSSVRRRRSGDFGEKPGGRHCAVPSLHENHNNSRSLRHCARRNDRLQVKAKCQSRYRYGLTSDHCQRRSRKCVSDGQLCCYRY